MPSYRPRELEGQPDGRRLLANHPRSTAVKYTYAPRIRASFDQWYGFVRNTEQRKAAVDSKIVAESAPTSAMSTESR
jgi:hypothetical protein